MNRFNCNSCFVNEERRRVPGHLPHEEKSLMDLKQSVRPAEHLPAPKGSWDFYYTDIFYLKNAADNNRKLPMWENNNEKFDMVLLFNDDSERFFFMTIFPCTY